MRKVSLSLFRKDRLGPTPSPGLGGVVPLPDLGVVPGREPACGPWRVVCGVLEAGSVCAPADLPAEVVALGTVGRDDHADPARRLGLAVANAAPLWPRPERLDGFLGQAQSHELPSPAPRRFNLAGGWGGNFVAERQSILGLSRAAVED